MGVVWQVMAVRGVIIWSWAREVHGMMRSMAVKKNRELELYIEKMAFGGKGLAFRDGFVVFVEGAVVGDKVRVKVYKKKKDYAEARVLEVVDPSPDRVAPHCRYVPFCGGCQWQYISYKAQLKYKTKFVEEALAHIGGFKDISIGPIMPSEKIFGYRNKMEFSFSDKPWLPPEEFQKGGGIPPFALGLHLPGTFNKIIDMEECLLQPPLGNQILKLVKAYVASSGLPAYNQKTHEGFWRFLCLRHSDAHNEWMVNLVTSEERVDVLEPLAQRLKTHVPTIRTVVNNITRRRAGVAVGERETTLLGDGMIEDRIGPYRFRISANSFFQTNTRGAKRLYEKVIEFAALSGKERVVDLYCGTGTISIFLAKRALRVTGLEISEVAVRDAQKNCRDNFVDNCEFIAGDIRETFSLINEDVDVVVVDPPRAGMHRDVVRRLLSLSPPIIVYVSCNPSTLARDLEMMKGHYSLEKIQPIDMFPHTYHVESVARLVKTNLT